MNDQVAGQLRQFLQITGTLLTTIGVLKPGIADTWIPVLMTIAGPIMMLGSIAWSVLSNSKTSIIKSASAMPEVKSMTIADPGLAAAAKSADPGTKITERAEDGVKTQ